MVQFSSTESTQSGHRQENLLILSSVRVLNSSSSSFSRIFENYGNISFSLFMSLREEFGCNGCSLCGPAGHWFGIELDQPTGKHDGSVFGVRYFSCLPKYGVFAPPSRVQRYRSASLFYFLLLMDKPVHSRLW